MATAIEACTTGLARKLTAPLALALISSLFVAATALAEGEARFSPIADDIWMTNGAGSVRRIHEVGSVVYVGGDFTAVRASRFGPDFSPGYLAAFDRESGVRIGGFQPSFNGGVRDIASSADGSVLYVGGAFTVVNGVTQRRLVALDPSTGATLGSFGVDITGSVNAVAVAADGDVLVGGTFQSANGETRSRLARFDPDGILRAWAPVASDAVLEIYDHDASARTYVGGRFLDIDTVGNSAHLVAFDQNTGLLDQTFDVQPGRDVFEIDIVGNDIALAMGGFGGMGAVYELDVGDLRGEWAADGDVQSVTIVDDMAYFGGHWEEMFGTRPSMRLQGVKLDDLTIHTDFEPVLSGANGVWDITHAGQYLWVGGELVDSQPVRIRGFARFSPVGGPDPDPPSTPTSAVASALTDDSIELSWGRSFDPAVPVTYRVEEGGTPVTETIDTTFVATDLDPDTQYNYRIIAYDKWGNESIPSNLAQATTFPEADIVLVATTSTWRYHDEGADLGTAWRGPFYDDSSWDTGVGAFGFNAANLGTTVESGPSGNRHITTYLRRSFIANGVGAVYAEMDVRRDDGVVVYLNGTEVLRSNMPEGTITSSTRAADAVLDADENIFFPFTVDPGSLVAGENVIAVELHQVSSSSSDLAFDLTYRVAIIPDGEPPTTPTGLNTPSQTSSTIDLDWTASSDNVAVSGDEVFRGAVKIATVSGTSHTDTGLVDGVTYTYRVRAVDLTGPPSRHRSTWSSTPHGRRSRRTCGARPRRRRRYLSSGTRRRTMWPSPSTRSIGTGPRSRAP